MHIGCCQLMLLEPSAGRCKCAGVQQVMNRALYTSNSLKCSEIQFQKPTDKTGPGGVKHKVSVVFVLQQLPSGCAAAQATSK